MPDTAPDYDPELTERLLEEGGKRLRESRRLLDDLDADVARPDDAER